MTLKTSIGSTQYFPSRIWLGPDLDIPILYYNFYLLKIFESSKTVTSIQKHVCLRINYDVCWFHLDVSFDRPVKLIYCITNTMFKRPYMSTLESEPRKLLSNMLWPPKYWISAKHRERERETWYTLVYNWQVPGKYCIWCQPSAFKFWVGLITCIVPESFKLLLLHNGSTKRNFHSRMIKESLG